MRSIWAFPGTFIGLLLASTFRRRVRRAGVLLAEGASWPRRIGWRYRAITFGRVVLCVNEIDETTFAHELVHVRQWERWGPLFFLAYPFASMWALVRGRHPYRDNRFEIEARGKADSH